MIIQNLLFPTDEICTEMGMYFNGHDFEVLNNRVKILADGQVNTDTYFNSISIQKWQTYTNIGNLKISLSVSGKCEIYLCHAWIDEKNIIRRKGDNVVFYEKTDSRKKVISLEYPKHPAGVVAYFQIRAKEEAVFIYSGNYETDLAEETCQDINIALGICTYKREEFIKQNISSIKQKIMDNPLSDLYGHLDVYISDNGQTLEPSEFESEGINLFPNKNVGGSGGFTRCMIEVLKQKEEKKYTHIIFMDDDILLDCNVLERNYIFLKLLKEQYKDAMIGGAMLVLNQKFRQFENAANYYHGQLNFTQKNADLRTIRNVIKNEMPKRVNYNAWCYCCMPLTKLSVDNLPLPLFIHMDDVEYGVRNKFKVITLNGICVWHPFFANQRSTSIVYYDMRNKLIAMAEFGGINIKEYATDYLEMFHRYIFNYDYERTIAACRGIEDFCKGIDYFKEIDPISLNMDLSRKNRKWEEADEQIVKMISAERPAANISRSGLLKSYFLPTKQESIVLDCDISDAFPYRTKRLYLYNKNTEKYCVYERSLFDMLRAKRECRKARKLIKTKLVDASFEWKDRINELTNLEFWNYYLDIEGES